MMPRTRRAAENDRGAVTVETAIALTSFVLMFTFALFALAAVITQVRCTDAASAAARLAARGEPEKETKEAAHRLAPSDAEITVTTDGEHIEVVVEAPANAVLPGVTLTATAYAMSEPDT